MPRGLRAVLLLSCLLLSAAAVVPAFVAADTAEVGGQPQADDTAEINQTLTIDLKEDGDARWTITKTYDLDSRNETEAFDELATEFENGETDDLGLAAFVEASRLASESTGREMEITDINRTSERTGTATNGTGKLSISFTWTQFGRVEGDRFHVDDVFRTDQGPWLEGLDANQRLVIVPPDGYEFFDAPVPVTLRNGTIQWTGPQDFETDSLSATFEKTSGQQQTTNNSTATPDPGTDDEGSMLWMILVVLGVGTVAMVGYLLVREDVLALPANGDDEEPPAVPTPDGSSGTVLDDSDAAEGEAGADDDDGDDTIDEELLSDEERVERLLERNGGRMKQANIVKETGWSNAKVSQLLSSMDDDDDIDKLRIGRENLISLPDVDVDSIDSP